MRAVRTLLATTFLTLVAVLTPVALVAAWVEGTVTETERYVDAVAPLAGDADVQAAVERRLTERVVTAVADQQVLARAARALERQGVPPALARTLTLLADPLRERLEAAVGRAVRRLVEGEAFAEAWAASNEVAHEQLVGVLSGRLDLVEVGADDTVSIRLATLVDALRRELVAAGVPGARRIPPVEASFPITRVEDLERAQTAYRWLDRFGAWLPWVVAALAGLAVITALDRRRALARVALTVVVGAVTVVVLLTVGRQVLLDLLPPDRSEAVATSVFDALTSQLRVAVRLTALPALLVFVVVALLGPSPAARSLRSGASRAWAWTGTLAGSRPWVRPAAAAAAVAGVVLLLAPGDLGPALTLTVAAVVALSAGVAVRTG